MEFLKDRNMLIDLLKLYFTHIKHTHHIHTPHIYTYVPPHIISTPLQAYTLTLLTHLSPKHLLQKGIPMRKPLCIYDWLPRKYATVHDFLCGPFYLL